MQDTIAFVSVFTVPTDAGPNDDRIVIGPDDEFAIFHGPDLVLFADINGLIVGPDLNQVTPFSSDAYSYLDAIDAHLKLKFPTNNEPADIRATRLSAIDRLRIRAPHPTGASSSACELDIRSDGIIDITTPGGGGDLHIDGKSAPRGIIGRSAPTANNGPHTGSTVTDFTLPNLPMTIGRTYRFDVHSLVEFSAAAGQWNVFLRQNGANIVRLDRLVGAEVQRPMLDASFHFTATATTTTDDWDIQVTEVTAGADLTLLYSANDLVREFTCADVGVL